MTDPFYAAVDLGATSGRVLVGRLDRDRFILDEVARFPTPCIEVDGHLHWDADTLRASVVSGIRCAANAVRLNGVGVDTWGVDYARLDSNGTLLEPPFAYRDTRTHGVPEAFFSAFPAAKLYAHAGLQTLEFNTVFQLVSSSQDPLWASTDELLFLPDLFTWWLSGAQVAELTIASTSGLLDVTARKWSPVILGHVRSRYGLDLDKILAPIVEPGTRVGTLPPAIAPGEVPVIAVGSHDTASAVASIPAQRTDFAYISSGTWSLVGLELDRPILTEESRLTGFTNELGIDATVRYLRNVMGLWVLSESIRHWNCVGPPADSPIAAADISPIAAADIVGDAGPDPCAINPAPYQHVSVDLPTLLDAAGRLPALRTVVDMEDPRLIPPGDMPSRLARMARETGQPIPRDPAEFTRCILDSLALDYRRVIRQACRLANRDVQVVHIVGGGCRNQLLNQLTAEATGLPVIAGPVEGAALGNLLVQARTMGSLTGDLTDLRRVSRASCALETYSPGILALTQSDWDAAEKRAFSF